MHFGELYPNIITINSGSTIHPSPVQKATQVSVAGPFY